MCLIVSDGSFTQGVFFFFYTQHINKTLMYRTKADTVATSFVNIYEGTELYRKVGKGHDSAPECEGNDCVFSRDSAVLHVSCHSPAAVLWLIQVKIN